MEEREKAHKETVAASEQALEERRKLVEQMEMEKEDIIVKNAEALHQVSSN